eukprot:TRINITY_DN26523_c0_g1_i1.p1 TRINITY_DN26523_c0_g1~~TRINITY_DN26523_c0_g1_i1.p1  ORF type:complete len:684 (+),score=149.90 TRINITY_DN26523_c0_g1_i1:46-2052(+)
MASAGAATPRLPGKRADAAAPAAARKDRGKGKKAAKTPRAKAPEAPRTERHLQVSFLRKLYDAEGSAARQTLLAAQALVGGVTSAPQLSRALAGVAPGSEKPEQCRAAAGLLPRRRPPAQPVGLVQLWELISAASAPVPSDELRWPQQDSVREVTPRPLWTGSPRVRVTQNSGRRSPIRSPARRSASPHREHSPNVTQPPVPAASPLPQAKPRGSPGRSPTPARSPAVAQTSRQSGGVAGPPAEHPYAALAPAAPGVTSSLRKGPVAHLPPQRRSLPAPGPVQVARDRAPPAAAPPAAAPPAARWQQPDASATTASDASIPRAPRRSSRIPLACHSADSGNHEFLARDQRPSVSPQREPYWRAAESLMSPPRERAVNDASSCGSGADRHRQQPTSPQGNLRPGGPGGLWSPAPVVRPPPSPACDDARSDGDSTCLGERELVPFAFAAFIWQQHKVNLALRSLLRDADLSKAGPLPPSTGSAELQWALKLAEEPLLVKSAGPESAAIGLPVAAEPEGSEFLSPPRLQATQQAGSPGRTAARDGDADSQSSTLSAGDVIRELQSGTQSAAQLSRRGPMSTRRRGSDASSALEPADVLEEVLSGGHHSMRGPAQPPHLTSLAVLIANLYEELDALGECCRSAGVSVTDIPVQAVLESPVLTEALRLAQQPL